MEPRIQYAKTNDGVSIAFWTLGEGMPFVHMPWIPWSHIQLSWQLPRTRHWYQRLSEYWKVVAYDGRGTGLSERDVTDFSLDANVLDLEAVVDRLGLERFVLFGFGESGPVAIAYAARHPERVSHLVLWCAWAQGPGITRTARGKAVAAIRESGDWELYTETLAMLSLGRMPEKQVDRAVAFMRQCASPDAVQAAYQAIDEFDVTELLPQVRSPTLVLHARTASYMPEDVPTRLASGIPDARLAIIEGVPPRPYLGDVEVVLSAIDEFLGEGEPAAVALPSGTAVILFADIAGSTALTERIGDTAFRDKARELDMALRGVIREAGGTPVEGKLLGDGVLAVFTSARQAIEVALRCGKAGEEASLPLHLGVHAGDVIREEDPDGRANVYGGAVNIAARIAGASAPGEVLVSDTVRGLARTSAGVTFDDRGEQTLKGVADPQRLFAVREGNA